MGDISVSIARGDGIGPEICEATVRVLEALNAPIKWEEVKVGLAVYEQGITTGITQEGWDSLRKTKVFLKAPISTPQGGGMKSLNVTIRKTLGLYANVRPNVSFSPFIESKHKDLDVVIVRENEEDLYAGIEHRQTRQVVQCLKLLSTPGSEKIIRYAFEYARANGRKKVSCFSKDNIMKLTDGMFHKVFDEIAPEYPEIETDHYIIDIGTARLADTPERFDVIVTSNLYGDIISDVAAQLAGSVGLAGSANIGEHCAMFEAIHGAAPDIAGQGIANPSGMLFASVQMLLHIGQNEIASKLQNSILTTIEKGIHTGDIYNESLSAKKVNTQDFASAVIDNIGQEPGTLKKANFPSRDGAGIHSDFSTSTEEKTLVGVDVFLDWSDGSPDVLGAALEKVSTDTLHIVMITNRGVKVWPNGFPETFCTDHWRCRFMPKDDTASITHADIINLLSQLESEGLDFIKTEHLCSFDGVRGFSLGQGQ